MTLPKKALAIRQPWAWAILHAGKNVENRSWHTSFRGPICIHASKGMHRSDVSEFEGLFGLDWQIDMPDFDALPRGGIVGTANIVDCVPDMTSKWFFGPWGFVLTDIEPVPFIPVRGLLGFFDWQSQRIEPTAPAEPAQQSPI